MDGLPRAQPLTNAAHVPWYACEAKCRGICERVFFHLSCLETQFCSPLRGSGPVFEYASWPDGVLRLRRVLVGVLIPEVVREFVRCRMLRPLLRLLRGGVTPKRLAWSLALGMVLGINPSVGVTTLLVVVIAWVFGLNQVASQIGVHSVAPLHLLLFVPFIDLGVHLFHTRQLPMNFKQLERLEHHPLRLFHAIWQWEWHALVIWGVVAAVGMPLLALVLRRGLVTLMRKHRALVLSRGA